MHLPGEPVDRSGGAEKARSDDERRNSTEEQFDSGSPSLKSSYNPDDKTALTDIAAIRKQLAAGNLEQAAFRASLSLLSFPGHPVLTELESEIQRRIESKDEVRRLMDEARQYRESRNWRLAVERCESALHLDPSSKSARAQMAQVYADWARDALPNDPNAAEELVQKSLKLDSNNPAVQEVQLLLLQHATRDIVDRAVIKARELRARDELAPPETTKAEPHEAESEPVDAAGPEPERPTVAVGMLPPPDKSTIHPDESTIIQSLRTRIEVGTILAQRYKILALLGAGGMGSVYKAQDLLINQTIALKIVLPSVSQEPKLREKFKQEMLVARRLTHPNVVRIYDIGEHHELLFISMELIEGKTVADMLLERKRFTVGQFLPLFHQFTSALAYIHSQHILHRDIKPQNLMYDQDGNLKVMDFGIARNMASDETTTSIVMGTPSYMSPELIEGAVLTPASDVYSAGALFYELLTGVRLFPDGSLHDRLKTAAPRVSERVPGIPRELDNMIHRCLQFRPEDRFQSVAELVAAVSTQHAGAAAAPGGTLADFIRDEPASLLDVLPIFVRVTQKLSAMRQDPAVRHILTPQTIRWTQDVVDIEVVSADEAQHTRAVDCKYACFDDFNEAAGGGAPRVESDVYVIGFIFYEILLGQKLFRTHFQELYKGNWNFQWLQWHSDPAAAAAPLKQVLSGCPPALSDAIESMMQKSIDLRPDFTTVEAAFTSVLELAKRDLMKTEVIKRAPQKPEKTRSAGRMAAFLIFGALLAFAAWWFVQGGSLP